MSCAIFKLFRVCIFSPHEREQDVHKSIHPQHSELATLKVPDSKVVRKETQSNIAADTVALTETGNKFSQSLRGLIHRCKI